MVARHPTREVSCPTLCQVEWPDPTPILLSPGLQAEETRRLLKPYRFQSPSRADANLQSMAGGPQPRQALAKVLKELLACAASTADPDQAINEWERYVATGIQRVQLYQYLEQAPWMLHLLSTVFGNSPAMAETCIRDPLLIYWLGEEKIMGRYPTFARLERLLRSTLAAFQTTALKLEAIRRFKRREMLRIGIRDLLRIADLPETVSCLSHLASLVIQTSFELIANDVTARYGVPSHRNRRGEVKETGFVVLGMGKLGGGELNYSSDVDLVYLSESSAGHTQAMSGQQRVSNEMFFETLARELTQALSVATQEGALFRVDLRLRPEGAVGPLARSLDEAMAYYRTRGRNWERLAFLKAWPVAGDKRAGRSFMRRMHRFVYEWKHETPEEVLTTIHSLKGQIHHKMNRRGETTRNVKLGTGGIREIEFIVQSMQVRHAAAAPRILTRNTLLALNRLKEAGLLSQALSQQLNKDYQFLRDVEHKLQMVDDLQTHLLPQDPLELERCAVRLGYPKSLGPTAAKQFLSDFKACTQRVNQAFETLCPKPS